MVPAVLEHRTGTQRSAGHGQRLAKLRVLLLDHTRTTEPRTRNKVLLTVDTRRARLLPVVYMQFFVQTRT